MPSVHSITRKLRGRHPYLSITPIMIALLLLVAGCGGGSDETDLDLRRCETTGGDGGLTLLSITFPTTPDLSAGDPIRDLKEGPFEAPLWQPVVFTFSGPVPATWPENAFLITGDDTWDPTKEDASHPVSHRTTILHRAGGEFIRSGHQVIFRPHLVPADSGSGDSAVSSPNAAGGGSGAAAASSAPTGLAPGRTYRVFVPIGCRDALPGLTGVAPTVRNPVTFTTRRATLEYAYAGLPKLPPKVVSVTPKDGSLDVGLNTFHDLAGFPTGPDIEIRLDQPLPYDEALLAGSDLDGDGVRDPNFFLGWADPGTLAAFEGGAGQDGYLARLNVRDDTFDVLGFTEYQGQPLGLRTVAFLRSRPGGAFFPLIGSSGTHLYDVDYDSPTGTPPVVTLLNERPLTGGHVADALITGRDGTLFGLDRSAQKLMRIDPASGDVEVLGDLPSGPGDLTDLAMGIDNRLYGLRLDAPGTGNASARVERIILKDFSTKVVVPALPGDYRSFGFLRARTLALYDAAVPRRVFVDLPFGQVVEYGQPLNDPALPPGTPLRLDLKRYELALTPDLLENGFTGSKVRLEPSGILPIGDHLDILVRYGLESLAGESKAQSQGKNPLGAEVAATVKTFDPGTQAIDDRLVELFLDHDLEDPDYDFDEAPALWDAQDPDQTAPHYGHLLAGLGRAGTGDLGDFLPLGIYPVILLDTDYQTFPLPDGSTPDVKAPVTVTDGVFRFRDILIPDGVTVIARGSRPLVLAATGRVDLAGVIDVSGEEGTIDRTFNMAYLPNPGGVGGAGGGRGGMGQPPIPADYTKLIQLQSVPRGESGYGPGNLAPTGGEGGESGAKGPDVPWKGSAQDKGSRGAGGGGGTFLQSGAQGYTGKGKYGVDLQGDYYVRDQWDYWDGSYKYVAGWDPSSGPPPDAWKINLWDGALDDHRAPHPGDPGKLVFVDADPDNDFFGAQGELARLEGGQGGGGGGSRLDGMNPEAAKFAALLIPPLAASAMDAKGGGGGGAGGAVAIHALGEIVIRKTGAILARGGRGGGGEVIGHANFGGGGGGGSGGAVVLESGQKILLEIDPNGDRARIDVAGGWGADAKEGVSVTYSEIPNPCEINPYTGKLKYVNFCTFSQGDGGYGGHGLIQLMVPDPTNPAQLVYHDDSIAAMICQKDQLPNFPKTKGETGYSYYHFDIVGSYYPYEQIFPFTTDCLVPPVKTPATLSGLSFARSRWVDTGSVGHRPDVGGQTPPLFEAFEGASNVAGWAVVNTTSAGHVINAQIPDFNDIAVDAPDLALEDFIPPDNEAAVQFQGTDALFPGSGIPDEDPATMSDWTWDLASLSGREFIRFRVRLDTAKGGIPAPSGTKPQVGMIRIRMRY